MKNTNTSYKKKPFTQITSGFFILIILFISIQTHASDAHIDSIDAAVKSLQQSKYEGFEIQINRCLQNAVKINDKNKAALARYWLGKYYIEKYSPDDALENAIRACNAFKNAGNDEYALRSRILKAEALFMKDDARNARILVKSLEKDVNSKTSRMTRADFFIIRGRILRRRRKFDMALKNADEALRLSQKDKYYYGIVEAAILSALIHSKLKRNDNAQNILAKGLEAANESERPYLMGRMQEATAMVKQKRFRFKSSLEDLFSALSTYKLIKNKGRQGAVCMTLGSTYPRLNDAEKSREYNLRAISLFRETNNIHGWMEAILNYRYSFSLKHKKELLDTQIKEYDRILSVAKSQQAKARVYYRLARLYWTYGKYNKTKYYYKKAIPLFDKAGNKKMLVICHSSLGMDYSTTGNYKQGMNEVRKALKTRKSIKGFKKYDDFSFFTSYSPSSLNRNIGHIYLYQSMYPEARKYYEKSLKLGLKEEAGVGVVTSYMVLMRVAMDSYDLDLAMKTLEDSLNYISKMKNTKARGAQYNMVLSQLFSNPKNLIINEQAKEKGSIEDSMTLLLFEKIQNDRELSERIDRAYREWIDLSVKMKSAGMEVMARTFYGGFCLMMKRYPKAESQLETAVEKATQINGNFHKGLAYFYLHLLHRVKGNENKAKTAYREVMKNWSGTGNEQFKFVVLRQKANVAFKEKEYKKAISLYKKALDLSKKGKNNNFIISTLEKMSKVYNAAKQYDKSIITLNKALKTVKENNMTNDEADILTTLCKTHLASKSGKDLEPYYNRAYEIYFSQQRILKLIQFIPDYGKYLENNGQSEKALSIYKGILDRITIQWQRIPKNAPALRLSRKSKTGVIFERTIRILIKQKKYEQALKYLEMSKSIDLLNSIDLEKVKVKDEKLKAMLVQVKTLRRKMSIIQREMSNSKNANRKHALGRIMASTKKEFFTTINIIRRNNPDFERLLSVRGADLSVLQKQAPSDSLIAEYYPAKDALFIFLVSDRGLQIRRVDVGRDRLYALIKEYHRHISDPAMVTLDTKPMDRKRRLLYSLLITPIQDEIDEKKYFIAIPSGLLWYLPFETLLDKNGVPFVKTKSVGYLSSTGVLRLIKKEEAKVDAMRILLIGAPPEADLPSSLKEILKISAMFPDSQKFTGNEATRDALFKNAPHSDILHVATHSRLKPDDINRSYIRLAGKEGVVELGEIYGLTLKPHALVILSSCESALGENNPGREFTGLASAFTTAGASTVIASLWKVDDEGTYLLFQEFYKNVTKGESRAESLRKAKIKLLENNKTNHPYYWGAFILVGEWK